MSSRLRVDPIACEGHGMCMELLPELLHPDDWGFPIVAPRPVPPELAEHARRAVDACPVLALLLEEDGSDPPRRRVAPAGDRPQQAAPSRRAPLAPREPRQPRDPQPRDPQPRDPQPRDPQPRDPSQPRDPPVRARRAGRASGLRRS